MVVFEYKAELTKYIDSQKAKGLSVGFVPTMGALHQGHISLVLSAAAENDLTVVSIFVNPTQFDNASDLENYPQTLDRDLELLEKTGKTIVVFNPDSREMYRSGIHSEAFDFDGLEHEMEGRFRTGHFDGVGTVVKHLLETVQPHRAYFGEKDFQQLQIIRKMVEKENIPVEIIGCPIMREADGLAMSSRNERLSKEMREAAPFIYRTISDAKAMFGTENAAYITEWIEDQFNKRNDLKLEYAQIAEESTLKPVKTVETNKRYRLFIAVFANDIRLIDNIALN